MTPEELLDAHTRPVAALAAELRRLVRASLPDAEERVYVGWHGLGYVHPVAGYVCGIFPAADVVKLGFEQGRLLADPAGLLTEGGRQVRYVVLRPGRQLPAEGIGELIEQAVDLGA